MKGKFEASLSSVAPQEQQDRPPAPAPADFQQAFGSDMRIIPADMLQVFPPRIACICLVYP